MGAATAEIVAGGKPSTSIARAAVTYGLEIEGAPRVDKALAVGVAHQVGPFSVETIALRGHTPDGTAYRIRELDVLIAGDYLSSAEFPFATTTSEYRATLTSLIDLLRTDPPGHVVPGHGPALTAPEAIAIAEADLAYLHALRAAVAAAAGDRGRARTAATAVPLPRPAPADLAEAHAYNVEVQLEELFSS
jgi:glyoxylase-like metal-dependent hydrolase (beta-lactamase superfamily II)